jgi:hypothetical protein
MDRHASELEETDVEGVLGFAERVLSRAADPSGCRRRSNSGSAFSSCFSERIAFDGKAFVRTALTVPAFNWLG